MKKLLYFIFLIYCNSLYAQVQESNQAKIAYKIVETSPRVKEMTKGLYERVIKNGGQSYGIMLDSSPNPKSDPSQRYSKTYDFNLHESYSDRMPIIARFVFDAQKQQLYEYNTVSDKLIPIAFNRALLLQFKKNKK